MCCKTILESKRAIIIQERAQACNIDSKRRSGGYCAIALQQRLLQHIPPESGHSRRIQVDIWVRVYGVYALVSDCFERDDIPASHRVQKVRPLVHHGSAFSEIFCPIVCSTNLVPNARDSPCGSLSPAIANRNWLLQKQELMFAIAVYVLSSG